MLYEYALEPALLNNWKDFRYFTEKFGVSRGRMISRYPRRWKQLVYESLSNCGEIERKRIEEGLSRLDDRLLARQNAWNPQHDWLTNAEAEHLQRPFHAILAKTNPNLRDFVLEGDSVDETHPLWNVGITLVISRTAPEMGACVALLLRVSNEIMFIDPYFRPHELRHRRPLEAFLSAALENRYGMLPTRIEIHTGDSLGYEYFRTECEQRLPSIVPEGIQVHIVRWREKDGGEKLHNRYILTDIGGVSFGVGLDDGADGETDEVTLLEDKTYQFRRAQYTSPEAAFELVDELMIEGKRKLQPL
jgi:hypothetical protein